MPTDKQRLEFLFTVKSVRFNNQWDNWTRGRRDKIHQFIILDTSWKDEGPIVVENKKTYRKAIDAAMRSGTRKVKTGRMKPPSRGGAGDGEGR